MFCLRLPISHPAAIAVDINTHAPTDHNMASITPGTSSSGEMPMPAGLIPIGNSVSATGNSRGGLPKPPATSGVLGGASAINAMAAMRNQYEPLPWTDFFDSVEMINDTVPVYLAGS